MSKPEGAAPVGVSNVDMKTDVWLVMHNGVGHEVVLVEDFNAMAKELAESRALLTKLYGAGFNMLGSSGKKRQVYAHQLESALREIEVLVPEVK